MDDKDKFYMLQAMMRFGGSFVQALGQAFGLADSKNFTKLEQSFPDEVKQYTEMGKEAAKREGRDL